MIGDWWLAEADGRLATSDRRLVTGDWQLAICDRPVTLVLGIRDLRQAIGGWQLVFGQLLWRLMIGDWWLATADRRPAHCGYMYSRSFGAAR